MAVKAAMMTASTRLRRKKLPAMMRKQQKSTPAMALLESIMLYMMLVQESLVKI